MRRRAIALAALLMTGCPVRETPCHRVCERETECGDQEGIDVDRNECVEECTALDRDPRTQPAVASHSACVDQAGTCKAALACP